MALVRSVSINGVEGPAQVVEPTPRKGARRRARVLDPNTPPPESKGPHKASSHNAKREP